jgi:hypothetical protein
MNKPLVDVFTGTSTLPTTDNESYFFLGDIRHTQPDMVAGSMEHALSCMLCIFPSLFINNICK